MSTATKDYSECLVELAQKTTQIRQYLAMRNWHKALKLSTAMTSSICDLQLFLTTKLSNPENEHEYYDDLGED